MNVNRESLLRHRGNSSTFQSFAVVRPVGKATFFQFFTRFFEENEMDDILEKKKNGRNQIKVRYLTNGIGEAIRGDVVASFEMTARKNCSAIAAFFDGVAPDSQETHPAHPTHVLLMSAVSW